MSSLVELRRYRLRPGRRDELIALFEREFVTSQEAVGLRVLGWCTDRDEPDHFVWFRGFADADPDARGRALRAFYEGPAWREHGAAANATMLDSDDVHLLRPRTAFLLPDGPLRVRITAEGAPPPDRAPGALTLDTAGVPNTFPRLPVHSRAVVVDVEPDDGAPVPGAARLARCLGATTAARRRGSVPAS